MLINSLKTLNQLNAAVKNINNHWDHIITGYLNIVNNDKLCQLISKGQKPKQIHFEEAREEIQTSTDQLIVRISNDKGIYKNHFRMERSCYVISKWKKSIPLKIKSHVDR